MADQTAIQFLRFPAREFIDSSRQLSDNAAVSPADNYSNARVILSSSGKHKGCATGLHNDLGILLICKFQFIYVHTYGHVTKK